MRDVLFYASQLSPPSEQDGIGALRLGFGPAIPGYFQWDSPGSLNVYLSRSLEVIISGSVLGTDLNLSVFAVVQATKPNRQAMIVRAPKIRITHSQVIFVSFG